MVGHPWGGSGDGQQASGSTLHVTLGESQPLHLRLICPFIVVMVGLWVTAGGVLRAWPQGRAQAVTVSR